MTCISVKKSNCRVQNDQARIRTLDFGRSKRWPVSGTETQLNMRPGSIDAFEGIEGDPQPGDDPKCCAVPLLKGLYGMKNGPRICTLELHSVLLAIGFKRIDCGHLVHVYRRGNVRIMMAIHLLLASNSKTAIQKVKAEPGPHCVNHEY